MKILQLNSLELDRMLVQGDKENEWFPAKSWQKDFVNSVIPSIKEYWSPKVQRPYLNGMSFSNALSNGKFTYKIGWGDIPEVIVNVETGKVRNLWFPLPPPFHEGAEVKESEAYFSYK